MRGIRRVCMRSICRLNMTMWWIVIICGCGVLVHWWRIIVGRGRINQGWWMMIIRRWLMIGRRRRLITVCRRWVWIWHRLLYWWTCRRSLWGWVVMSIVSTRIWVEEITEITKADQITFRSCSVILGIVRHPFPSICCMNLRSFKGEKVCNGDTEHLHC